MDIGFMIKIAPDMAAALWMTVRISLLAIAASVICGALFTALRMLGGRAARRFLVAFVEITRGAPPLVHIAIIYFLLLQVGLLLSEFWTGVVALSPMGAGYTVEIFRGPVESIGDEQTDAARALGLSRWQTFFLVLLPQAVRRTLPPLTNELANGVNASSLLSVISVVDGDAGALGEGVQHAGLFIAAEDHYIYCAKRSSLLEKCSPGRSTTEGAEVFLFIGHHKSPIGQASNASRVTLGPKQGALFLTFDKICRDSQNAPAPMVARCIF